MTVYTTHLGGDPQRPPVLVPEKFSWWGLFFGWVVFLRPGSWLVAMLAGLAELLTGIAEHATPLAWPLMAGLHLAIGLFAHDWRRWELRLAGFVPGPIIAGPDRESALLRLLSLRPELIGGPA